MAGGEGAGDTVEDEDEGEDDRDDREGKCAAVEKYGDVPSASASGESGDDRPAAAGNTTA